MANVIFDAFKKLMSALHGPITRDEHVQRYEFSYPGLACPKRVKFHSSLFMTLENLLDGNPAILTKRMPNGKAKGLSIDSKSPLRFWELGTSNIHTESTSAAQVPELLPRHSLQSCS